MQLTNDSWYVRWFFWSLSIRAAFRDEFESSQIEQMRKNGTNLCFFIRLIIVYTPLVIALHVVVYGAAIASLTWVPVHFFGLTGYFSTIGAIALVIGSVFLIKRLRKPGVEVQLREKTPKPTQKRVVASPTFRQLLWAQIVKQKQKICPTITFSGEGVRS